MNTKVLNLNEDSDIEISFESTPIPPPKPLAPVSPLPLQVIRVRRQKHAFNPKPCSFCRREFRDKVTVARHTVRHHWKAMREQNYGKDKKGQNYFRLPDDREIQEP